MAGQRRAEATPSFGRLCPAMTKPTDDCSRRLRRLQSQPCLDRIAHQKLLDLSRHRHRKLVDEFDVTRDLVVCDLPVAEAAYLVSGERLPGGTPDPGAA